MNKSKKIKQTIRATRKRREHQVALVYKLKLQNLSKRDKEQLDRLFLEAKWLYNYIIADIENRLKNDAWKLKEVAIKTPSGFEKREINRLSSQMRQGIVDRIKRNLYALKKAKERGLKVEKLRFKSEIRSIPLKQYGVTYSIFEKENKIKLQGIKKKFRVLGLRQILQNAEFAEGQMLKKASGYYLHVVCYLPKEQVISEIKKRQTWRPVGIDLGIKYQMTLSNGKKFQWYFAETKRLKRLQKILARKKKGSKNYQKVKNLIRKDWEYIVNKRNDALNKAVSYLKQFSLIVVQDDCIKGWYEGWFGKQVQNTGIGGITARLKNLATLIPVVFVERYKPTTQICYRCDNREEIPLSERTFKCKRCGSVIDRDVNSARNILKLALWKLYREGKLFKTLPVDGGEVTPVERVINTLVEAGSSSFQ